MERRRQIGFSAPKLKNNDVNCQVLISPNSGRNARMIATQRTTRMLIAVMILCVSVSEMMTRTQALKKQKIHLKIIF